MSANNYKQWKKYLAEKKHERQLEYWRRWKDRQAPKKLVKFGWTAVFEKCAGGWAWKAKKAANGAVLQNGPFASVSKAKKDFYKAVWE